ncbi:MAG: ATP-grasp domain-containing protein [Rhodospirillales bacterium]|nr:ATP-grasp domain-containing protein [Rhodospirillales bacterium]
MSEAGRATGKVLVLGDDTRSFLACVRSLGRAGLTVHAGPANFRSPALASRYIAAVHDLPPWMDDGAAWLAAMRDLLAAQRFDLVIPCNETALLPLDRHRAELAPLARLAIPGEAAIEVLFDKVATRELAQRLGVPVAPGRTLRAEEDAAAAIAELGAPVLVKPRHSYTLERLAVRGKVQLAEDAAQLAHAMAGADPAATLLEGFVAGRGLGVSVLASGGRVLQAFEHHRVHEHSGSSYYRVSAPLSPDLLAACEAITAALDYTGLAMFEFRRDAAGRWVLLEVNARPWGSMPLPLALGIDFPFRWYRLLVAGEETRAVAYRAGVHGRNLLPDLQSLRASLLRRELGPGAKARIAASWAAGLLRPLWGREVHDVLVRDDPRPALAELAGAAREGAERLARHIPGVPRRRARGLLRAAGRSEGRARIVFVCQGNICRSPFAAALLRSMLEPARTGNDIEVRSAGMMPWPGRASSADAINTAAQRGIDLSAHRSAWLSPAEAQAATVLIVFDETNRAALLDRYPAGAARLLRLGDIAGIGAIADPWGRGTGAYETAYDNIERAVRALAEELAG